MNVVVVVCIVLVLVGAVAALRWGHLHLVPPWPDETDVTSLERMRRGLWYLDVLVIGVIATGLTVIGPGGRLVMRLLAVTAGDAAQGRITEADEVVGEISVGGTIGLVLFVGLFGGLITAVLYGALRKWLPPARTGALLLTLFAAVTLSTRVDPLRPDNRDFGIVGPGWLSVTAFLALGALSFLTFAAVVARVGKSLPLVTRRPMTLLAYLPLVLLIPSVSVTLPTLAAGGIGLALLSQPGFRSWWSGRAALVAGRVIIGLIVLACLPKFVGDIADVL